MKRLTKRTVAGTANIEYKGCLFQDGTEDYVAKSARRQLAIDRLASYEDTGLEPEEIEQLKGEVFGLRVDKQNLEQVKREREKLERFLGELEGAVYTGQYFHLRPMIEKWRGQKED